MRKVRRDARSLSEKRLAMIVAENRGRDSREAAQVLADLREEKYGTEYERIRTGRVQTVQYDFDMFTTRGPSLLRPNESVATQGRVHVPSYETLYNVQRYARAHHQFPPVDTERYWSDIWLQWITPRRNIYTSLVRVGALPRSIRFHELEWRPRVGLGADDADTFGLYLVRTPPRRKRPQTMYLFDLRRGEYRSTRSRHFEDERQQEMFGRSRR